ncbi:MAG: DUF6036 family nucleotidyltransferase [Woeseiaceae bacterium]
MDLSHLQALFLEARRLTGHTEFVVVGSLSILGVVRRASEIPERMLMSIDVDCYTKDDPGRIFELQEQLGEGSRFEEEHGYYLDPVTPQLSTLPAQWTYRLIKVELGGQIAVHFLDPNDAAVSKYARCDVRDREWIKAGLDAGLLSTPIIQSRFLETEFLDEAERERARKALAEDAQLGRD